MSSREAFEAWMTAEQWFHGSDFEWDGRRNCYSQFGIHLAYKAWLAAISAMEAKYAALAAESAAQKNWRPNPHCASMFEAIEKAQQLMDEGMPESAMLEAFEILKMKRTPATDAFLAEVRAQGVDEFAAAQRELANKYPGSTSYAYRSDIAGVAAVFADLM